MEKDEYIDLPFGVEKMLDWAWYSARFRERVFHDTSEHCQVCFRGIAQRTYEGYLSSGYVSLHVIKVPGEADWKQWEWVCRKCFRRFRKLCRWTVLPGEPEALVDYRTAKIPKYRTDKEIGVIYPREDILRIARKLNLKWEDADVEKFVSDYSGNLNTKIEYVIELDVRRLLLGERKKTLRKNEKK